MQQNFIAGTQYNDFVGTVAADRSDEKSFGDYLRQLGLITEDETVVGFEIVFNENNSQSVPNPGIVAFIGQGNGADQVAAARAQRGHFALRSVEVFDLPLADFFSFFKRFNVMMANRSLELDGASYEFSEG